MKPATPARAAASGNLFESKSQQRVQVAHEQQRCPRPRLHLFQFLQQPGQRESILQRRKARALDRGTVGHRITERNPDFDHVRRGRDRRQVRGEIARLGNAAVMNATIAGRPWAAVAAMAALIVSRGCVAAASSDLPLQQGALQRRHVLVATPRQADQDPATGVFLCVTPARRPAHGPSRSRAGCPRTGSTPRAPRAIHRPLPPHNRAGRCWPATHAQDRRQDSRARPTPNASPGSGRARPAAAASSTLAARPGVP